MLLHLTFTLSIKSNQIMLLRLLELSRAGVGILRESG